MNLLQLAPGLLLNIARNGLSHWQWPQDCQISLIKLRENAVYSVTAADGRRAALRLHRPNYHSEQALRSELQWMMALHDQGVPTTRVIPSAKHDLLVELQVPDSSQTIPADLMAWVDGQPIGSAEDCDFSAGEALEGMYAEIGGLAAAMHLHSAAWVRPSGFQRAGWDFEGCLGANALWGHYSALQGLGSSELQLFERAVARVREQLQAYGQGKDRFGLVHGDLVPDNVMRGPAGLVVLDFDDCGYSWYLWELATALFWHLGEQSFDPAWTGYLRGYRQLRALPDSDLTLMPAMFLMRALVYMGWMHTRRETETARQLTDQVVATSVKLAHELLA